MKIVQAGDAASLVSKERGQQPTHQPLQLEGRDPSFQIELDTEVTTTTATVQILASVDGKTYFPLINVNITPAERKTYFVNQQGWVKFVRIQEASLGGIDLAESFKIVVAT